MSPPYLFEGADCQTNNAEQQPPYSTTKEKAASEKYIIIKRFLPGFHPPL